MSGEETIRAAVEAQRAYFRTGETLPVSFRIKQLKKLRAAVQNYEKEMADALREDLGRSETEAYLSDTGALLLEINEAIHGLPRWEKPEVHFSGLHCFPSITTTVYKMPYGVSLIISPFNFPFLLSLGVLVPCIAAGNTAVLKASSKSKACTAVLKKLISETFEERYITVIDGGHAEADICLSQRFDKIFYTGSPKVGKHVMEMAAKNLTPVTLELGGENGNWAVIRKDADIRDAARKIAFFKMLNSGQICININQIAVAEEIAEEFLDALKQEFVRQIGERAEENPEYPCMITDEAYEKCVKDAEHYKDRIAFGGRGVKETRKFAPTILYPIGIDEEIVQRELFSPILPVVTYKDAEIDQLLDVIASREHGLAFYLFTADMAFADQVMRTMQYGGGCINEVCLHLMVKGVPFGGTGHSGMGTYHGEWGFREFTHPTTVLRGSTRGNLSVREHPYSRGWKKTLLKLLER